MSVIPRSGHRLAGVALLLVVAACGPAPANTASVAANKQPLTIIATVPTTQPSTAVLWGRVPYCNCFAGSATANVANALKEAKLTVSLKELSPRDGWLYFAATFDPTTATSAQVSDAMVAGGAELRAGPP